jgi:hypothetical protein
MSFSSPSNRRLLISDQQRAMRLDGKNGWQFGGQKHWSSVVLACPSPSASYQVLRALSQDEFCGGILSRILAHES